MKTTGFRRIKVEKLLVLTLIIVFSVMAFTACNQDNRVVKEISVVEDSVSGYYVVGEFDITKIRLNVIYEDESTNEISAEKSMLTTEGANSLTTPGKKSLTINYKRQTVVLEIYLVADGAEIACVTFKDSSGNKIAQKYTLVGGAVDGIEAPAVSGQKFIGWVDSDGKAVDLTKIEKTVSVTASYSVNKESYKVRFTDFTGKELKSGDFAMGGKVKESDAPSVSLSNYPTIESFSWSESFPFEVVSDITIKMVPTYKQCTVMFAYALESNETAYTYVSTLRETVQYGADVKDKVAQMERFLLEQGYEIAKKPSQSTVIKASGSLDFIYIVKDASIKVKVFNDSDKKTQVPYDSPMKIGTQLIFPTSAATVNGSVLSAWKVSGELGSVDISVLEGKWTVSKDLGMSIEVIPIYSPLTVPVVFKFDFKDDKLPSDDAKNYELTLTVNDSFVLGDAVTYAYIDNLLKNITNNKEAYLSLLKGQSAGTAVVGSVKDNGSSARTSAFEKIELYGITSVKNIDDTIAPGKAKVITASGMEFIITVSATTNGIEWAVIKDENEKVIGYKVVGLNSEYNGDNIFVSDSYTDITTKVEAPVIEIAENAFAGKNVTKLSANLKKIGSGALLGATLFGNVNLSKLTDLGANAFENVTFVGDRIIFSAVKEIKSETFKGIKGKSITIDLGTVVTSIGNEAFANAEGVVSVIMPNTVTAIGDNAFKDTGLASITDLSSVETVGDYAFSGTAMIIIDLPAIKTIGEKAFANNEYLIELNIGANGVGENETIFEITSLEDSINLEKITFGKGVKEVSPEVTVLASLKKLSTIKVSSDSNYLYSDENVLYLIENAEDKAYRTIYYPNNKIGNYKAVLPEGASLTVDATAFMNATVALLDLTGVSVTEILNTTNGVYAVAIAEGKTIEAQTAFVDATVVTDASKATFGYDERTKIIYQLLTTGEGENATQYAVVISGYKYAEEIIVPATLGGKAVKAVADGAFANFENLETLTVEAVLDGWNSTILNGISALRNFSVEGWDKDYKPELTHFANNSWYGRHNIIKVGGVLVGYNNTASIGGRPITVVTAEQAEEYFEEGIPVDFFAGTNITEIYLPRKVKIINENAFMGSDLEKFEAQELTLVGLNAFKDCNYLEEIVLNFTGVASTMYENAFENCTALTKATINGDVNGDLIEGIKYYSLPAYTFSGCVSLSEVVLEKINKFGKKGGESKAFYGCEQFTEFDFTKIIGNEIPNGTFTGSGLKNAILTATTLTTVGQEAFGNCSALRYVQFGGTVTVVEAYAFNGCTNLIVELSYDNGGLYDSENIGVEAFPADAKYFIQSATDDSAEFLQDKDYTSSYPIISFMLTDASKEMAINFAMTDITTKILITENDVIAPVFEGYTFAGWFTDADETNALTFPTVISNIATLYAKYYDERQGSVSASTDIKYVYYLGKLPEVDLDSGETVEWYYSQNGGAEISIIELPFVTEAIKGDEFKIMSIVRDASSNIVNTREYTDLGELGYAVVGYSGNNPDRMSIPDVYEDDDGNGSDEIIALFAGAFKDCIPEELFIPQYVKAIFTGNGTKNDLLSDATFDAKTTFGNTLKYVTIPAGVEYIADGVFIGNNIEEIVFEENSNLTEATEKAFFGSKWWNSQLEQSANNYGFVIAGRLAIKFVGTADMLMLPVDQETVVSKTFGFVESTEEISLTVTVYNNDGTMVSEEIRVSALLEESGVYRYVINANDVGVVGEFALNTEDSSDWTYKQGSNLFILTTVPTEALGVSIASTKDTEVTVPNGIIKLGDRIFENNSILRTMIINKELVTIGNEAFMNSGLASIRYGVSNSEQYVSEASVFGKDAFKNTPWYRTEKVILGTKFLKYNNVSGAKVLTITESITAIKENAFKSATLTTINISTATLTEIGAFAFKGSSISSIILPKSVEKLGRAVFAGCASLVNADLSLTKLTMLPDETFKGAAELGSLMLPTTVTGLGKDCLTNCIKLASITANGVTSLKVGSNGFESGLSDTAWYGAMGALEEEEDSILKMGNVLVKYIVGTKSRVAGEETGELVINIPEGISMIAYMAFAGESSRFITSIVIPDSVTEIGNDAFNSCSSLKSVQIGSGVLHIGARAFKGLSALKEAVLPNGLLTIGDGAFLGTALTSEICDNDGIRISDEGYTIPDSVTEIGANAFYGVSTLTVINLGAKLIKIGENAFNTAVSIDGGYKSNLYKINWNLDINKTQLEDGTDGMAPIEVLAEYIANNTDGKKIFVSGTGMKIRFYTDEVTADFIKSNSKFLYATNWNGYGWTFYKNDELPEVTPLGDGYTLAPFTTEYIKEGDIPVPPHSTDANNTYTFMYWVVVKDRVETRLEYPYVVTEDMDIDAKFYKNEVTLNTSDDNGVTFTADSGDKTATITGFSGESDVLYIPNKLGGKTITAINAPANDTVKTLVITNASNFNGMTTNIFGEFTSLEKIELHSSETVADYKVVPTTLTATYGSETYKWVFYMVYSNDKADNYGERLIAVVGDIDSATEYARGNGYDGEDTLDFVFSIPEGVTEIYPEAMLNNGFKTVSLPSTINTIGDNAFGSKLERLRVSKKINITDISASAIDSVTPIMNKDAGKQVGGTDYIELNGLRYRYENKGDFYAIANVLVGYQTAVTVYRIDPFELPSSINNIDITVLAREINKGADIEADTISLPTNLQRINSDAFSGINFKNVVNAEGYARLRDIANYALNETDFYKNNQSANGLYVGKILVKWENAVDGSAIKSDTIAISSNAFRGSNITKVIIPDSVVSIGENAFYGCVELTEIVIPNSVTVIGNGAFMACKNLTKVTIDTINSTLSILGESAFEQTTSLKSLRLPYSLKTVGARAFATCTALTNITFDGYDAITQMPDETKLSTLTELGESAFLGARNLTTIKIPERISVIKSSTFENCSSLVDVNFTENSMLVTIENSAFSECASLGSIMDTENPKLVTVEMPNSLITVGYGAFLNCSGMWGISFGHHINYIGEDVFMGCKNLAKVVMSRATAPIITGSTFRDVDKNNYRLRIYVQGDSGNLIKTEYKNKWSSVWDGCASYIYELGETPVVKFKNDVGETREIEAEVLVNPKVNFGAGEISTWEYDTLKQKDGTEGTREGSIKDYKNQKYEADDITYVFLVVDYDEITLTVLSK